MVAIGRKNRETTEAFLAAAFAEPPDALTLNFLLGAVFLGARIDRRLAATLSLALLSIPTFGLAFAADGSFYEVQLGPTTEEKDMVYIKSLETRFAKAAAGEPKRQVMDYVTGVQLLDGAGKPALWELGGENPGPSIVHDYWDWAY